jgi:hypothetical protein
MLPELVARPLSQPSLPWSCPRGKSSINDGLVHVAPRQIVTPIAPSSRDPSRCPLMRSNLGSTFQEVALPKNLTSTFTQRLDNKGVHKTSGCRLPATEPLSLRNPKLGVHRRFVYLGVAPAEHVARASARRRSIRAPVAPTTGRVAHNPHRWFLRCFPTDLGLRFLPLRVAPSRSSARVKAWMVFSVIPNGGTNQRLNQRRPKAPPARSSG